MLLSARYPPQDFRTPGYETALRDAQEKALILIHHDAITGTHSLTAKRDYDERILQVDQILQTNNNNMIQEYDRLYKGVYGRTRLEEIATKIRQAQV